MPPAIADEPRFPTGSHDPEIGDGTMQESLGALAGIAVVVLVVVRQMRPQVVDARRMRIAAGLGVIGLVETSEALSGSAVTGTGLAVVGLGLLLGGALGVARGRSMRVWTGDDGRVWTRGTRVTALWWLVSLAVHVGVDVVARAVDPAAAILDTRSVLLFVAVTLGAQGLAVAARSRSTTPAVPAGG